MEALYTTKIARTTTDPNILRKILEKRNDDYVSRNAAFNKNCPPDALRMVLERGKNDTVSRYAAFNKNCPFDISIQWKMKVGLIKTESPEHKIQYVNKQRDDSDLKKLQELLQND